MRTRIAADPTRSFWPANPTGWTRAQRAATRAVFLTGRALMAAAATAAGYALWAVVAGTAEPAWLTPALDVVLAAALAWAVALLALNRHLAGRGLLPTPAGPSPRRQPTR